VGEMKKLDARRNEVKSLDRLTPTHGSLQHL
jgi:hypothetical protein